MRDERYTNLIKALGQNADSPFDLQKMRKNLDLFGDFFSLPELVTITTCRIGGRPTEIMEPKNQYGDAVLFYIHGGGYVAGSVASHRQLAARIAEASKTKTVLFEYRLAPEAPFPASLDDCESAYRELLEMADAPSQIALVGDSAGGGLCVALMLRLRKSAMPMPKACVCLSPWVDLTMQGSSWKSNEGKDALLNKEKADAMVGLYLQGEKAAQGEVSPVFADLSGLPNLLIHASLSEVLCDDALALHNRASQCGVQSILKMWEDMVHVWHFMAPILKEGRDAIYEISDFLHCSFNYD